LLPLLLNLNEPTKGAWKRAEETFLKCLNEV